MGSDLLSALGGGIYMTDLVVPTLSDLDVDHGTAGTPNSLGLPDGRSPFSRCIMVGLFAVLRSLATHGQLMFSDVRDVFSLRRV